MFELLSKYMNDGNYQNALLVAQNMFNKNNGDKQVFDAYFSLLFDAANKNIGSAEKIIEQMVSVLSVYSENAELNESEVDHIRKCEEKLNTLVSAFQKRSEESKIKYLKAVIEKNDSLMKEADLLLNSLEKNSNKSDFEKVLKEIYELDEKFDKTNFVLRQKNEYEEVTSKCQKIVDVKLKEFERIENIEYNKKAIASYEKVFNLFRNPNNSTYKSNDILELFSYDSSRLTNETLIYYNHVYNYILSKLNDDEKLTITRLAIIAEKKG